MASLRRHIYQTFLSICGVSAFYILSSVEHDITKDPFVKLGEFRDWALERKPVEAPADSRSHH